MLTNDFRNPFLTRSFVQLHNKVSIPFFAMHNQLDSFSTTCPPDKPCLPHMAHLPLQQHHQQQRHHHHHPLLFLPPHYHQYPSHYPPMYPSAVAAAEHTLPISRHIMSVTPSLGKAYLPPVVCGKSTNDIIESVSASLHIASNNGGNICNMDRHNSNSSVSTRIINSNNSSTNRSTSVTDDHNGNFLFYQGKEKSERGRKIFLCPQCHYVTDRKNNLKRHIITMHQECTKVLECCGVVFHSKASLREHVSLFHSSGYGCRICGRNFCRKALLRRHLSVHSGQKDFICPFCSYATSHKSNLERHQKVHNKKTVMDTSNMIELNQELVKAVSENGSKQDSVESQSCTLIDTCLYRSSPINGTIGTSRIKKLFLPDRLSQTYSDVNQELSHDDVSAKDFLFQLMGQRKHQHINSVSSSSLPLDEDKANKIIKRKPPRIFMASYKCIDCRNVFSHQSLLNSHSCMNNRHYEDTYLSIVRPLARKQIFTSKNHDSFVTNSTSVWGESDRLSLESVIKRNRSITSVESQAKTKTTFGNTSILTSAISQLKATKSVDSRDFLMAAMTENENYDIKDDKKSCCSNNNNDDDDENHVKKTDDSDRTKPDSSLMVEYIDIEDSNDTDQEEITKIELGEIEDKDGDAQLQPEDRMSLPLKKRPVKDSEAETSDNDSINL